MNHESCLKLSKHYVLMTLLFPVPKDRTTTGLVNIFPPSFLLYHRLGQDIDLEKSSQLAHVRMQEKLPGAPLYDLVVKH